MQNDAQRLFINLGRKEESPVNLFVTWTVNTGRIIIVLVELLTLAALGYRFIIDRQIVDLNDQIETAQRFVDVQSKNEALYRNIQSRLTSIQILQTATQKKVSFLNDLVSYLNTNEFISTNLNVSDTQVVIDGQTYSIFTLNNLVSHLKQNPEVTSISIDQLNSLDQGISFKVTTRIKDPTITL